MKKSFAILLGAGLLAAAGAYAAEAGKPQDVEAKLAAARARLELAAREVAELSGQMGDPVMDHFMMLEDGSPRRAVIGVLLDPASPAGGARVKDVSPGGPAAEAGVRPNDLIVMVNGVAIKDDPARQVVQQLRKAEPDSKVNLRVLRNGESKEFDLVPRRGMDVFTRAVPAPPGVGMQGMDMEYGPPRVFLRHFGGAMADMQLTALTPQLGRYFGTAEGVLVLRAAAGENFKLEDGDVIQSIDGRKPTSGSHAIRILRSYQPGEKITLRVLRLKKPVSLEVTIPPLPREGAMLEPMED